jgi:hypothetical protein
LGGAAGLLGASAIGGSLPRDGNVGGLSFKRSGEIFAPPRVTYTNKDADSDTRRSYRRAIDAAIERCTPMPFTDAMGGAIAGRTISIRFIDKRRRSND